MSTKTYFKRISLAVILALSFGALSSAPSQAILSGSATLTLSATTDSKVAQETSTVTITAAFTSNAVGETFTVKVLGTGAATQANTVTLVTLTDSQNITSGITLSEKLANAGETLTATSTDVLTRAKITLHIRNVATVGTHTYNVNLYNNTNTLVTSTPYTLTVAAANSDATASQSLIYINDSATVTSARLYTMADSTLVKSAGQLPTLNLMTPSAVAYLGLNFKNSAGESVVSTTSTNVDGRMTVKITSGPGLLSDSTGTLVRQVVVTRSDTVTIYNDGSSGVTTIVGYIGNAPLAQAAKTLTFYGKATTFTATANAVTARGWNLPYTSLSNSDTVDAGNDILSFVAKDATGLAVPTPSQNIATKFYVNTSDTKIVRSTTSATSNFAECTISATATEAAAGKYYCDMYVIDSGTVTLTVMDSETVAKSTYTSNAISVTIAGPAVAGTIGFAKLGTTCTPGLTATGTFEPGESVIMCLTAKDGLGRNAGQIVTTGKAHDPFSWSIPNGNVPQDKPFWIGGSSVSSTGALTTGATTLTTVNQFLTSSSTFVDGVETVVVYMPTTSGDINIKGVTGSTAAATADTNTAVTATLKVTGGAAQAAADAAAAAAKAAEAAAVAAAQKAAADAVAAADKATAAAKAAEAAAVAEAQAAFDAASEAIDAANAATDAANLAAEAADAATVAAEEARDAADAATAAVEELATQVASLMAALRAQITTLANTVVKIAKKVKA